MPVAIAIAAGIFICGLIPYEWHIYIAIAAVGITVIIALLGHRSIAIIAGAAAVGIVAFAVADGRPDADKIIGRHATARGIVIDHKMSNSGQILTVRVTECQMDGGERLHPANLLVSVAYPSFSPEIEKGEEVIFTSTFSAVESQIHLPDELDIAQMMHDRGIWAQTLVKPDSLRYLTGNHSLYGRTSRAGRRITEIIFRSPLSSQAKEFLATTVAGQSESLSPDIRESFTRGGLAHVLALSGLHAGIVMGLVMIVLWPLKLTRARRYIPAMVIVILWMFALVTGMSASVTRATVMATVMLCALMLQRRHSPFNALCLAAILILIFDPLALKSTGFMLSFLAVAGILIFSEKLNPVSRRNRMLYPIVAAIAVTVSAMLATGLVSAYTFHTFPVYFLIANIAAAPLLPLIVGAGVILMVCGAAGWYPDALCSTIDTLCRWLMAITDRVATLPGATVDNIYLRVPELLCAIAAIIALAFALHRHRKILWITTATLTLCTILLMGIPREKSGFGVRIVPTAYRTDIIASAPEAVDIITTASQRDHDAILEESLLKYRHHMGMRGIETMRVGNRRAENSVCRFDYPILETATRRIVIADRDSIRVPQGQVDILLVCRGFKGDILTLARMIKPDTVMLSTDLTPARRNRYHTECEAAGLAVRNLAENPYSPESCL